MGEGGTGTGPRLLHDQANGEELDRVLLCRSRDQGASEAGARKRLPSVRAAGGRVHARTAPMRTLSKNSPPQRTRRTQRRDSTRPACGAGLDVRPRGSENEPVWFETGSFSDPLGLTSPLRGAASNRSLIPSASSAVRA